VKGLIGIALISVIAFFACFGPLISGYAYDAIDLASKNQAPSYEHWFGTDELGRDLFTRVWQGARISLAVGIAAALIDLFVGIIWGSAAAFARGRIDEVMMSIAGIFYAIPTLLIVILLIVVLGTGIVSLVISLTLLGWITMARIVRGQVLQIKHAEFVLASQALGGGFFHIMRRHLIPNARGPIFVTLLLTIASVIFMEAFLSFLGLGVQAPMASWGSMANEGLPVLPYYPWRLMFPAALICLTILAFNLIGESLDDQAITQH